MSVRVPHGTGASSLREACAEAGKPAPARAKVEHQITAEPDIAGAAGKAWLIDVATARKNAGVEPDQDGTVAAWVVEAPLAHPVWHSYMVLLIHLRPLHGKPAPRLVLANASHEIIVYALDPKQPCDVVIAGEVPPALLTPVNFAAQFIAANDAAAMARVEKAVTAICDGRLDPDTDGASQWIDRFGDNCLAR